MSRLSLILMVRRSYGFFSVEGRTRGLCSFTESAETVLQQQIQQRGLSDKLLTNLSAGALLVPCDLIGYLVIRFVSSQQFMLEVGSCQLGFLPWNGLRKTRVLIDLEKFAIKVLIHEWHHESNEVEKAMNKTNRLHLSVRVCTLMTHHGGLKTWK